MENMEKRWFVFESKMIYYYKRKTSHTPLGILPITKRSKVYISTQKKIKKKNCFEVDIPGQRIYLISAPSEQERDGWIAIIQSVIDSEQRDNLTLKDFKVISVIGRGSYGKVTLVEKNDTHELFAMKSLQKGKVLDVRQIEQTMAEREVLMKAKHPFLISLKYSFQDEERLYMVLDYANGGDLFHHLRKFGKFSLEQVRLYAAELVLGLDYLHKMDIIYRDLKLENVLLLSDGHLKITDFGLVKLNVTDKAKGTKTLCGTPEYMAPEIILETGYGKSADWWSLGILLYEMFVGVPPFFSENTNLLFQKVLKAPLKFPQQVPQDARDLISKLLQRDPSKRIKIAEIKKHSFFSVFDWDKVYRRETEPVFKPQVDEISDVSNFDEGFTQEDLSNSVIEVSVMGRVENNLFKDFSFFGDQDVEKKLK
eukprot:Anaeramoba_ignava/c20958_g1_i1.p1 GENE.c20958_g1_i1~~c20958_g1_i1.p1  ORF type:complete len:424 (-),score=137.80 c20958_g1_i1:27-1298(-)